MRRGKDFEKLKPLTAVRGWKSFIAVYDITT